MSEYLFAAAVNDLTVGTNNFETFAVWRAGVMLGFAYAHHRTGELVGPRWVRRLVNSDRVMGQLLAASDALDDRLLAERDAERDEWRAARPYESYADLPL